MIPSMLTLLPWPDRPAQYFAEGKDPTQWVLYLQGGDWCVDCSPPESLYGARRLTCACSDDRAQSRPP